MTEDFRKLVDYRLRQAEETLCVARELHSNKHFRDAVNLAYYAMFYACLGLLASRTLGASKHTGPLSDLAVWKYAPDGGLLWKACVDAFPGEGQSARAIALDSGGNVYLSGTVSESGSWLDSLLTIKLSPEGTRLWAHKKDRGERYYLDARAIVADGLGGRGSRAGRPKWTQVPPPPYPECGPDPEGDLECREPPGC